MKRRPGIIVTTVLLAAGTLFAVLLIADQQQRPSSTLSFQSPLEGAFPTSEPSFVMELFESPISTPTHFPDISDIQFADAIRPVQTSGLVAPFFGFMWSPDSNSVIYAQLTDQVIVYEDSKGFVPVTELRLQKLDSGEKSLLASNGRFPKWAPSRNQILYISWFDTNQSYIMLMNLTTGETVKLFESGVYAEWLSDDEIVVVDTEGKVKRLKLSSFPDDKSLSAELTVSTNGPNSVIVSPNRKYIALVNETQLSVFTLKDHQLIAITQNEFTDIVGGVAWSPQSDSLAYVSSKSISIARIDDSQIVSSTLNFQEIIGFPSNLSWSPDSRFLLYQGFDGIWVVDVDSSERKLLIQNTPDSDAVFSTPSWSPDGKAVMLENGGNIYVADLIC